MYTYVVLKHKWDSVNVSETFRNLFTQYKMFLNEMDIFFSFANKDP